MAFQHEPVLLQEVLRWMNVREGGVYCDGTLGGGGHSEAILAASGGTAVLYGIDRDENAIQAAGERLARYAGFHAIHGNFHDAAALLDAAGAGKLDGVLLDIGVSSPQIDTPERGFSWRSDGPLDMRMDDRKELTAGRLLNHASEEELFRIFRDYGELVQAKKLARAAVAMRAEKPFGTTGDLVKLCDEGLGISRPGKLPHPTLVFQALRIAVNDELGQLESALAAGCGKLKRGGRIAVISFHSLEDRIVKNHFRDESTGCHCPPGLPVCRCGHTASLRIVTRKPVTPGAEELAANRRSACAKLRVAEKIA